MKKYTKEEWQAFLDAYPSISTSGSLVGMYISGYWSKTDVIIRYNGYYYNLSKGAI